MFANGSTDRWRFTWASRSAMLNCLGGVAGFEVFFCGWCLNFGTGLAPCSAADQTAAADRTVATDDGHTVRDTTMASMSVNTPERTRRFAVRDEDLAVCVGVPVAVRDRASMPIPTPCQTVLQDPDTGGTNVPQRAET